MRDSVKTDLEVALEVLTGGEGHLIVAALFERDKGEPKSTKIVL